MNNYNEGHNLKITIGSPKSKVGSRKSEVESLKSQVRSPFSTTVMSRYKMSISPRRLFIKFISPAPGYMKFQNAVCISLSRSDRSRRFLESRFRLGWCDPNAVDRQRHRHGLQSDSRLARQRSNKELGNEVGKSHCTGQQDVPSATRT